MINKYITLAKAYLTAKKISAHFISFNLFYLYSDVVFCYSGKMDTAGQNRWPMRCFVKKEESFSWCKDESKRRYA